MGFILRDLKTIIYLHFWLGRVFIAVCGLSLVAVASLLSSCRAQALLTRDLIVVFHGLGCPKVCGILVSLPRIKCMSPASEGRFLTAGPPGKPPRSEPLGEVCFERQNGIRYSQG